MKNEIRYIHRDWSRATAQETTLYPLADTDLYDLEVQDNYFHADHIFRVCGKDVVVSGDMLADALKQLPPEKRDIILLSYFLEMTDAEIGKELNTVRQNISKRRNRILALMREYLEKEGFEWHQT